MTTRKGIAALSIAGGIAGGTLLFFAGVGVGMYPTEINGKVAPAIAADAPRSLPRATITAPPLPRATTTTTIKVPGATKTRYLPQATKTITKKVPSVTKSHPAEDDPGFDCRTQGNRICGPGLAIPAGCYRNGVRVIAWTNYSDPRKDPLWGKVISPC
jgi:hypothetical protein